MVRIVEAVTRYRAGGMSCVEAATFLGVSERHFRRLRDRFEAEGAEGIVGKRLGVFAPRAGGRGCGWWRRSGPATGTSRRSSSTR